jgi:hypothetical protein
MADVTSYTCSRRFCFAASRNAWRSPRAAASSRRPRLRALVRATCVARSIHQHPGFAEGAARGGARGGPQAHSRVGAGSSPGGAGSGSIRLTTCQRSAQPRYSAARTMSRIPASRYAPAWRDHARLLHIGHPNALLATPPRRRAEFTSALPVENLHGLLFVQQAEMEHVLGLEQRGLVLEELRNTRIRMP